MTRKKVKRERKRMIFDLPAYMQMAIRLRAIKNQEATSDTLCKAMEAAFPKDVEEAKAALEGKMT